MLTILAGFGLEKVLFAVFGVFVVVSILKKLFKLALTIVVIIAFVHFGLPILQTAMLKY